MQALGPMKWLEARQLEDAGGQLLRQLSCPYQPPGQSPGSEPLPRSPAAVARGAVPEPEQARLRERALPHFSGSGRQHPQVRARHVAGHFSHLPGRSTTSATSLVERRPGTFRAHKVQLGNHSLFPNGILGFRLALPRGPLKTEFWHFVLVEKDAPEAIKHIIRTGSQANNGAAGLFEQDDIDNWRR